MNTFSSDMAKRLYANGERASFLNIIVNSVARFLKFLLLRRGFLEGKRGWIVAAIEGFYVFQKYAKLWELEQCENSEVERLVELRGDEKHEQAVGE